MSFFWDGWEPVARILLVGTLGYAWLVVLLRMSGPRTLARMTLFDFVVTVTLGSAFGRVLTAQEVAVVEVIAAFAVLVGLQWLVAVLRARWAAFGRVVDAEPALLYHAGRTVEASMRRHRLTEEDLMSAARQNGLGSLAEAEAVVLQVDGTFAVITPSQAGDGSALRPVTGT